MSSKNIYVTLEGALLSAPKAYLKIGKKGDIIIIPISVLNKLYHFEGIKKIFATSICDYLSRIDMDKPTKQENGTFIQVLNPESVISKDFKPYSSVISTTEQQILEMCKLLSSKTYKDDNVVLLSQNPVILKYASSLGIKTQVVLDSVFPLIKDRYTGFCDLYVSDEIFNDFKDNNKVFYHSDTNNLHENQFIVLHSSLGGTLLGRYSDYHIYSLNYQLAKSYTPKNVEQIFLLESLYAPPDIAPLVIASGAAGTGKTYSAMSAAHEQLQSNSKYLHSYSKIIISTPAITDVGESLGYLPGSIVEKLNPYFGGIFDAMLKIFRDDNVKQYGGSCGCKVDNSNATRSLTSLLESGLIEVQPLGFLVGHSFENSFVIVDEAQNIDPNFFVNIITRISEDSKLVILGDPYQVKACNLSRKMNGIIYMMETWKDESLAWQITMNSQKSIRSKLCQRAIDIMT